jgi:lipopolysaccharide exporter
VPLTKWINWKGDLFATAFCFAAQGIVRLFSSLVLTRILRPEAYGVITILLSIVFVLEMLADIGVTVFIVRDKNAEEPKYLNTAWTLRLGRSLLNGAILFSCAPWISSTVYHLPNLVVPLQVFSVWFIFSGLESMSFPVAIRRKQSRITMYSDLLATCLSTVFTVSYCHFSRDYWGMIYGILLNRLLTTGLSYRFYPELRPKLHFDKMVAREILGTTKFTLPSGMLTLALSQFDKIALLRISDLRTLGIYGLAGNIAGPVGSLVLKISQMVLYPRCAHNYREDPTTFVQKYYSENIKLFASIMILPAAIGGAANLIVTILYPGRYAEAGWILQAFMLQVALISLASPAEDLLIATGEYRVILIGSICRVTWMFVASFAGYFLFGFVGFIYGFASNALPALLYYLWLQRKKGMLVVRYESYKWAFIVCIWVVAFITSRPLLELWSAIRLRI